jgi:radical SAM superfamily enzyme YgiQ (UPF0313 family)
MGKHDEISGTPNYPDLNIESGRNASALIGSGVDHRVVLIHPPAISKRYMQTKFMPYGMASIYAFLEARGIEVSQYDFLMEYLFYAPDDLNYHDPEQTFSEQDFFSHLSGEQRHEGIESYVAKYGSRLPSDAGMYCFSIVAYHQFWAALLLGSYIRKINPSAVIVFGGPFITIKPLESFVKNGVADFWVRGSGENPLLMLHSLVHGDDSISFEDVPGLIYWDNGLLRQNPQSFLPAEEEYPPDFTGLSLDLYRYDHPLTGEQTLFLPYRVSKGCPSQCSFCTGRLVDSFDHKSVDKIVREVKALSERYGTNTFQFADASVNGRPRVLSQLCDRLLESFPDIQWYSYAKVNGFTPELLGKAKAAGCFALFWGVESAHQPTISLLGKRFQVGKMYDLIDESIRLGIKSYIHLIYNTPYETDEDVSSFIRLVERYIASDMVVFLPNRFLLEPQSLMFEQPDKYGLRDIAGVEAPIFEREQYTYAEAQGIGADRIALRNERHLEELAFHLDWINIQNLKNRANGKWSRLIPSKTLARTAKYSRRHPFVARIHDPLIGWIGSRISGLSEQL